MFILISRGWGLVTFLVAVLCIPAGVWLGNRLLAAQDGRLSFAVGLLLCGIVLSLLGMWLNQVRAQRLAHEFAARRRVELDQLVESGRFNLGHPWPIPTSMAMAREQADQLYAAETDAYTKAQHNRHTLYWIPMQYWGFAALALAAVLAVTALFS